MGLQKYHNIKKLLEAVPHGFFIDSKWLASQDISRQLVTKYVKSGWLVRAAHGLYRRPVQSTKANNPLPDWELLVLSMQRLMGLRTHIGGTTALRLQGRSHYAAMGGQERVFLYADKMPGWLNCVETTAHFELRTRKLFKSHITVNTESKPEKSPRTVSPWQWSLTMSSPERAILETLDELPNSESFHHIDMIFQGLVNLRPRCLKALLNECTSVQVKRLFFVFADKHNHAWRKHINTDSVSLGSGDRSFVKGGKLHPLYRITVPPEFLPKLTQGHDEP